MTFAVTVEAQTLPELISALDELRDSLMTAIGDTPEDPKPSPALDATAIPTPTATAQAAPTGAEPPTSRRGRGRAKKAAAEPPAPAAQAPAPSPDNVTAMFSNVTTPASAAKAATADFPLAQRQQGQQATAAAVPTVVTREQLVEIGNLHMGEVSIAATQEIVRSFTDAEGKPAERVSAIPESSWPQLYAALKAGVDKARAVKNAGGLLA